MHSHITVIGVQWYNFLFAFFVVNGAGNGNPATTFFAKGTQTGDECLKIYCFGTYLISL